MQRADWLSQSRRRRSALPMVMLLAERLISTSAPASAAWLEGGIGVQTSSQISTWNVAAMSPALSNSRSTPNGTCAPATLMVSPRTLAPGAKCRFS